MIPQDEFRAFNKGYGLIPANKQREFREKAMKILGCASRVTFYRHKDGTNKTSLIHATKLLKLAMKYGVPENKFFDNGKKKSK